jgi:hypothetical protein
VIMTSVSSAVEYFRTMSKSESACWRVSISG